MLNPQDACLENLRGDDKRGLLTTAERKLAKQLEPYEKKHHTECPVVVNSELVIKRFVLPDLNV